MAKEFKCWHCGLYAGAHELWCGFKGYLNPAEPKPAPAAPALRVECPCGIARTDCDYHRPAPAAPYEYGAYDLIINADGSYTLRGRIGQIVVKGVISL